MTFIKENIITKLQKSRSRPETLGWAINCPGYFRKNPFAWVIYCPPAKYSLKDLQLIKSTKHVTDFSSLALPKLKYFAGSSTCLLNAISSFRKQFTRSCENNNTKI